MTTEQNRTEQNRTEHNRIKQNKQKHWVRTKLCGKHNQKIVPKSISIPSRVCSSLRNVCGSETSGRGTSTNSGLSFSQQNGRMRIGLETSNRSAKGIRFPVFTMYILLSQALITTCDIPLKSFGILFSTLPLGSIIAFWFARYEQ